MSNPVIDRMKHLLSTGEDADVYFLVGDGDAKELLQAHKLILKHASEVFAAMFRFDAKNIKAEFASANCPVEVTDVEAAAFKVMLSFIYTGDLAELNGDNAMAVLYAVKKYNIPDLVDRSLQIPISELRNVFFAYAQALLFELEDFSFKCLRYICQNAAQLFGSDDFLQIDQKMLFMLLESDHLTLSNEFEIWKAALRWADEKCRQNDTKCSSENRRSVLGPALFKIRFPNIHEEQFSKCVVSSGVLTEKEVIGVYQFNSHPFLYRPYLCHPNRYFFGVPGLYSLKFPIRGRISDWNKAKGNSNRRGTLSMEIEKVSEFEQKTIGSERKSEKVHIKGMPWKILAEIRKKNESTEKWLAFYLLCDAPKEDKNWSCKCSTNFRIVSQKSGVQDYKIGEFTNEDTFKCETNCRGYVNFISFAELLNPNKGFYNKSEDKVTLAIDVIVK
ncbi:hypothetical protein niasHS_004674 [Heterodera schachtii]|uniref:BTB domain-containing protein n=1 Tax=Heterodera schachtii TaxID=97005 RepID=A0ABD2JSV0_HETSC